MKKGLLVVTILMSFALSVVSVIAQDFTHESKEQRDARMEWWRDSRFGLFIHWGLYSIPAGEWKGTTNHAEWIRTTAQIPLSEYDKFVPQFNPAKFDAGAIVRMAKDAGMKYIVITSKHHDGFCLFDSKNTDFDIMSTPFKRDVLKELADACHKEGIKICWYYSIMDWHHPDYLPRRDWEKDRPSEAANFDRYVEYMKSELKELLTNYGEIGVLWFDGEWEENWNPRRGKDLYDYVRKLQPNIIINNRVGAGRSGMEGMNVEGEFAGDFGTPEQEIPSTGIPGVDWETCMTMNDHWGYNKHDNNWKSSKDLIRTLADIASKGGNFLLNIGPTSEGVFPETSVERLRDLGKWMKVNGGAIYGTSASPFKQLVWGRCTQKPIEDGTRLYLHVFEWPSDGMLTVPGILNLPKTAFLLSDANRSPLRIARKEDALMIRVPGVAPDSMNSVVVLDVAGKPDINNPPTITADNDIFVDPLEVTISSDRENVEVRYTLDGSVPIKTSALARGRLRLVETTEVSARCFRGLKAVSGVEKKTFTKVKPRPSEKVVAADSGIAYVYFEGDWDEMPAFKKLHPSKRGSERNFSLAPRKDPEHFGFEYTGLIDIPQDGVYTFYTESDDGSRLYVGSTLVVNNDGLHGMIQKKGVVALAKGYHPLKVEFFQKAGGIGLNVTLAGPGFKRQQIPDSLLFHRR
jgi:alpha-L-fucosidase